jgi:hypothetical protein
VKLKNAQKMLSHLQWMMCLGITGGMRPTPTSALEVMLMLPPLHLFVTLNIFDRKFSTAVSSTVVLKCRNSLQKLALSNRV